MTQIAPAQEVTPVPDYTPLNRARLIAPGPVEVAPDVLQALSQPQMHHRAAAGIAKLMEAREKLTRLLGEARAKGLAMTGQPLDAETAAAWAPVPSPAAALDLLSRLRAVADIAQGFKLSRIHGDFHLGQVLLAQNDVAIIDFSTSRSTWSRSFR